MSVIRDIVAKINTTRLVYEPLTLAVRKSKSPTVSFIGILDGQIFRKNPQNPALSPPPLRAPYSVRATEGWMPLLKYGCGVYELPYRASSATGWASGYPRSMESPLGRKSGIPQVVDEDTEILVLGSVGCGGLQRPEAARPAVQVHSAGVNAVSASFSIACRVAGVW